MARVGPLDLRNPVICAAGPWGDTPEKLRATYDSGAGAVVTKSITLEPREGNPGNVLQEECYGMLNSIGLRNVGADEFSKVLGAPDYPVIVSLAGSMPHDFVTMVKMFRGVAAFELNVSCPNIEGEMDAEQVGDVVQAVKEATDLPVFVKIMLRSYPVITKVIDKGADCVTAINAIPAMATDPYTGKLFRSTWGFSGTPIRPIALNEVFKIRMHFDIPVIGCGGVMSGRDAMSFMDAGACAVQVGSAMLDDVNACGRIVEELYEMMG